jgi:hypothetical protein
MKRRGNVRRSGKESEQPKRNENQLAEKRETAAQVHLSESPGTIFTLSKSHLKQNSAEGSRRKVFRGSQSAEEDRNETETNSTISQGLTMGGDTEVVVRALRKQDLRFNLGALRLLAWLNIFPYQLRPRNSWKIRTIFQPESARGRIWVFWGWQISAVARLVFALVSFTNFLRESEDWTEELHKIFFLIFALAGGSLLLLAIKETVVNHAITTITTYRFNFGYLEEGNVSLYEQCFNRSTAYDLQVTYFTIVTRLMF